MTFNKDQILFSYFKMTEEKDKQTKKKPEGYTNTEIAVYAGIGFVAAAAVIATVVIVKRKREDELTRRRLGLTQGETLELQDLGANKEGFSRYWNWTVEAFGSVNTFISKMLSNESPPGVSPLVSNDEIPKGLYSDDEDL